jgi:hypothetical protein
MKSWTSSLAGSVLALIMVAPIGAQTFTAMANDAAQMNGIQNGIPYATGGVGLDARAEMQGLAGSYNLFLMFAESSGEFLVPESVSVRKGSVDVLNVSASGPLLFVKLPNGAYTVHATYKGVVRSKAINVAGRTPDVVLTWPAQVN